MRHTGEQVETLTMYVAECRAIMRLDQWDVVVDSKPTKPGRAGMMITVAGRYVSHLRVSRTFFARDPHEQRHTVCHELLHLLTVHVTDQVRVGRYSDALSDPIYHTLNSDVVRHVEYAVDHLANLLAPMLPLPGLPETPQ